ncbi:glycosyltransferase, partial [Amylibacter sp.]|nr:glycosyltransferase [Amylibacter sp.]
MIYIIMPGFNCADVVAAALHSLHTQTFKEWRLVFVNDGSTDSTEAVVREIADTRTVILSKVNGGVASARNHALTYVKELLQAGDCIAFLDSDDIWAPDKLYKQLLLSNHSS